MRRRRDLRGWPAAFACAPAHTNEKWLWSSLKSLVQKKVQFAVCDSETFMLLGPNFKLCSIIALQKKLSTQPQFTQVNSICTVSLCLCSIPSPPRIFVGRLPLVVFWKTAISSMSSPVEGSPTMSSMELFRTWNDQGPWSPSKIPPVASGK